MHGGPWWRSWRNRSCGRLGLGSGPLYWLGLGYHCIGKEIYGFKHSQTMSITPPFNIYRQKWDNFHVSCSLCLPTSSDSILGVKARLPFAAYNSSIHGSRVQVIECLLHLPSRRNSSSSVLFARPRSLALMKRSHVVLSMCAIFFACGLGVIVATVALSPTLGLGNATEVLVVESIKGGCAGCGLLIHSGTSPIQSSGILSIVNLGAAIILLSWSNWA